MIAVLHRHRGNVQLLLNARADPWQAVPIVSLCDHPWYWFGFLSRRESVNVLLVSVAQGPADTVADLLTQNRDRRAEWPLNSQPDLTAMTEHATLDSIVQKYQRSNRGLNICDVAMLRTAGDEYWPAYICRCELGGNFSNRLV